ncbi:MAG TPA: TauD/TfdA family dioxygenase [Kofleriaceae bacterium]|jgi:alpha-ketoglutarate-dependent taurine dioxygenase|nr:TauD/TfdA family dioxygenase [Kofleriaceae bacterium]
MAPNHPTAPLTGSDAWRGSVLAATPEVWLRRFTQAELAAIEDIATYLVATGWPDAAIDSPIASPVVTALVNGVRDELLFGRGFVVLRGLPVDGAPARVAARLWVLGQHLGAPVPQNARGHLLGHVRDLGYDAADPTTRLYQTNQRQGFHTDSADLVALLCLRAAANGGRSSLASAATAFNEVLARAPDLADALFHPVATDHRGEEPPGARPWFEIPVLSFVDQRLTVIYQRRYIESAARFAAAPRLDDRQRAALDLFDAVLDDPDVHLEMDLAPGDVQLVHNHQLLHDRTAFVDDPDPARRRHLLRLWLCPPVGRRLPAAFAERYGSIEIGRRGGVVPRVAPVIALAP